MRRIFTIRWIFVVLMVLVYPATVSYATIIAFYSDGVIQKGETYDKVDVYDTPPAHTTVDMTGGQVNKPGMFTYDSSTANISGGTVEALNAYGSSAVNIAGAGVGGTGESLRAHDWSTINISGGLIGLELSFTQVVLYDASVMNIDMTDGFIGALTYALDSTTVNVYAGELNGLYAYDGSTLNIYGGEVGTGWGFSVNDEATANIYGTDFEYDPQWLWDDDFGRWISRFTGVGPDGVPIDIRGMSDPFTSPNINLIPEPATGLLLGLGSLGLLRRRKVNG